MDEKAEQLLDKVNDVLANEGVPLRKDKEDMFTMIEKYALPAIQNLKEIQSGLYNEFFIGSKGLKGKLKAMAIRKIANVSRNTVELSLMRQQKFNDNVALILEYLIDENRKLRAEKGEEGAEGKADVKVN
jgi:hypothetical protein